MKDISLKKALKYPNLCYNFNGGRNMEKKKEVKKTKKTTPKKVATTKTQKSVEVKAKAAVKYIASAQGLSAKILAKKAKAEKLLLKNKKKGMAHFGKKPQTT